MAPDPAATFRMSLYRCLGGSHFMKSFYDRFVGSSEEVRERFEGVDMDRQYKMLADSLYVLAMAVEDGPEKMAGGALAGIAARHGRQGLGIPPALFDLWLAALLETVAEHDPEFSPEIERVWRETLGAGIEYMRTHH